MKKITAYWQREICLHTICPYCSHENYEDANRLVHKLGIFESEDIGEETGYNEEELQYECPNCNKTFEISKIENE